MKLLNIIILWIITSIVFYSVINLNFIQFSGSTNGFIKYLEELFYLLITFFLFKQAILSFAVPIVPKVENDSQPAYEI